MKTKEELEEMWNVEVRKAMSLEQGGDLTGAVTVVRDAVIQLWEGIDQRDRIIIGLRGDLLKLKDLALQVEDDPNE